MAVHRLLPLASCGVLVTRPIHQAQNLEKQLRLLGAMPFLFPTLDIQPVENLTPLYEVGVELNRWDYIIFTSVNSVWHSMAILTEIWPRPPLGLKIGAIGESTASALRDIQWTPHIMPSMDYSSEGLLDVDDFQHVSEKSILIIEGRNSRGYLENALTERGATVKSIPVYCRQCPQVDIKPLIHYWEGKAIQCVILTSGDGLRNLIALLGEAYAHYWKATPLCVISKRLGHLAREKGACKIITAEKATDKSMVDALIQWNERR